jgi:hypothetical protein
MGMFGNAFKPGGAGRDIAGYIGDALLTLGGGRPMYAPAKAEIRGQQNMLDRQLAFAQWKQAHPDPTGTMQNVDAALNSSDPRVRELMTKVLQQPHYMVLGSPENGQTVIDANNPPPAGGDIDPAAIARLKANPGEAALFDEHFGPGSAARVLGGQ